MKRRALTAVVALLVLLLSGCAAGTTLAKFDLGSGLSVSLPEDMQRLENGDFDAVYYNDDMMVAAVFDSLEEFRQQGIDTSALTVDDYAVLVQQRNGLSEPFSKDAERCLCYTREVDGTPFFYYTTLRSSEDGFWVISFACPEEQQDNFISLFQSCASSIIVK